MNEKKIIEIHTTKAIRNLNKTIKRVFGLENLAQVIYEIVAIENVFLYGYSIPKENINAETINNYDIIARSRLREYLAKYVTLKYFRDIGEQHILYKNIVLTKIPSERISWKSKNLNE